MYSFLSPSMLSTILRRYDSLGLLLLRLSVGAVFLVHGLQKYLSPIPPRPSS